MRSESFPLTMATFVFGTETFGKKGKWLYMKTRIINVIKITQLSFFVSIMLSIFHEEAHGH